MRFPRSTESIDIPDNPLARVIGQDEAVKIARVAAKQRRHLLLVGPPGTGKSMIAQAVAFLIPKPKQEVSVLHNPENPERPLVEVRSEKEVLKAGGKNSANALGKLVSVNDVSIPIAEKLGFRCKRCAKISSFIESTCPSCGADKYRITTGPFDDLVYSHAGEKREDRVYTTVKKKAGRGEELVAFERAEGGKIRVLSEKDLRELETQNATRLRKVILPLERNTFIRATGASETELLGDIKHDPYGGHHEAGTQPYLRVLPGAIHEAHEGVLFIDEVSTLGILQRFILTAMQEKVFPISGRNPSSTGAAVRVDNVPCDFIFIAATNTNDLPSILPPLRNRITGDGYDVLLNTAMPDSEENRLKLVQFVAQEIRKDGRIPHASSEALEEIIKEAKERAKQIDEAGDSLTLRMRGLAGLVKLAGDLAIMDSAELISGEHVKKAKKKAASIEEQVGDKYSSWWKAGESDYGAKRKRKGGSDVA